MIPGDDPDLKDRPEHGPKATRSQTHVQKGAHDGQTRHEVAEISQHLEFRS